ncbi:MAG: hypothetical protein HKN54_02535, partial [Flavobacteriaceae bacterium]|nr:hypothetical protein [Flavobacteriaceae bacterium]
MKITAINSMVMKAAYCCHNQTNFNVFQSDKVKKQFMLFLTFLFLLTAQSFAQTVCEPASPLDITPLHELDCTMSQTNCSSNDLQLVGAFLDTDTGCDSCDEGDEVVATLFLSINNTTGSTRTSFAVFGDLVTTDPMGNEEVCTIARCNGEIPPSGIYTLEYGEVTFTCGDGLSLQDLLLSWTDASPNSTCDQHDCKEISPKCGQLASIDIAPLLQATASAVCDGNQIDVDLTVQGGTPPYSYSWTGPGGFTANTEDLNDVDPGTYNVTVTDATQCTTMTSVTEENCCEFFATCNLDASEQLIEGCDESDLPSAFTDATNVFSNITTTPCGDLILIHNDSPSGTLCPDGLTVQRTYTLFDDLNNNQILDQGEEFETCLQNFRIQDTTAPVPPAAPADLNLQCASDVPPPVDLTATDNCDGDITVSPTANITPGACINDFVMVRTWTFTDECGNTSSVSQTITVNDDTAPV